MALVLRLKRLSGERLSAPDVFRILIVHHIPNRTSGQNSWKQPKRCQACNGETERSGIQISFNKSAKLATAHDGIGVHDDVSNQSANVFGVPGISLHQWTDDQIPLSPEAEWFTFEHEAADD